MGVRGLWEVAKPVSRPVTLESLAKKKLAVDASIWIYQFLKAVRDSEGNALRNAHIIGFFRRICKLLYFDIKPVFVFDGDAPTLKKSTINRRRERREGRRAAASQTAAKLLTVQLQRLAAKAEAEGDRSSKGKSKNRDATPSNQSHSTGDEIPENVVYFDERNAKSTNNNIAYKPFRAQDQYHLPDVEANPLIEVNDPRLMTEEELAEYADEFGSQINSGLYDTSLIDFESPEFYSLPQTTQYQLLNTARLRSRLRMGYSAEQLDQMFPNRMEFSKFQIQRVTQRNFLTQRVMGIVGLEEDLSRRVAGDKNREYILKKSENGWSLDLDGKKDDDDVIVLDQNGSEVKVKREEKPESQENRKEDDEEEEDDDIEFEDVSLVKEDTTPFEAPQVESVSLINENTPIFETSHAESIPEELSLFTDTLEQRQKLYDQRQKEAERQQIVETAHSSDDENSDLMKALAGKSLLFGPSASSSPSKNEKESDGKPAVVLPPWFIDSDEEGDNEEQRHIEAVSGITAVEKPEDELDGTGLTSYEYGKQILDERHRGANDGIQEKVKEVVEITDEEDDDDEMEIVEISPAVPETHAYEPLEPVPSEPVNRADTAPNMEPVSDIEWPPSQTEETPDLEKPTIENNLQDSKGTNSQDPSPPELNPKELELAEEDAKFEEEEEEELTENLLLELEESERFTMLLNNGILDDKSKQQYEKEIEGLREQHKKEVRDADEVTQNMVSECQELLKRFGIPYVTAPMEAEAQCATLMQLGLVDGIVTDDSDCFLFGGGRVYKNMFSQSKYVESYEAKDLEREFDLDRTKLIKLAQLLGSDYTDGLAGVGPVTALELLAEFNSDDGLEQFRNWWKKVQALDPSADFSSEFKRKFKRNASKLFLSDNFPDANVTKAYLEPIVDEDNTPFEWGIPDLDALRTFLIGMTGWDKEKVDEMLLPVIQDINKRRARLEKSSKALIQSSLSDFAVVSARKKVEIGGSKRVRKALQSLIEQADSRKKRK